MSFSQHPPADRPTDRPTDRPGYRNASNLKMPIHAPLVSFLDRRPDRLPLVVGGRSIDRVLHLRLRPAVRNGAFTGPRGYPLG